LTICPAATALLGAARAERLMALVRTQTIDDGENRYPEFERIVPAGVDAAAATDLGARLIELGRAIKVELEADQEIVHPREPELRDVYGVIFWQEEGEDPLTQRNVTVFADGEVDRSPCGSGTSARLALLHDEGRLATGEPFLHRSIVGTEFTGRVVEETAEGVITEVEGSAHLTGRHEFVLEPDDELGEGFLLR